MEIIQARKKVTNTVSSEVAKVVTKSDNPTPTTPISQGPDVVTDKINEKGLNDTAEERGVMGHIGDKLSNAYHYVAEKVQEAASVVSYDGNKEKVKDFNTTVDDKIKLNAPLIDILRRGSFEVTTNSIQGNHERLQCFERTVVISTKMTKKALVFISNGSEEIEAVATIDVLRRAEIDVDVVSIEANGHDAVKCSRNVYVVPDKSLDDIKNNQYDCVVIPGGNEG
ncbi:unnamed protein product [Rotaria magnacalcarata]